MDLKIGNPWFLLVCSAHADFSDLQPSRRTLDADSARALLNLKLSKRDLDRADALASQAAKGVLSSE